MKFPELLWLQSLRSQNASQHSFNPAISETVIDPLKDYS